MHCIVKYAIIKLTKLISLDSLQKEVFQIQWYNAWATQGGSISEEKSEVSDYIWRPAPAELLANSLSQPEAK